MERVDWRVELCDHFVVQLILRLRHSPANCRPSALEVAPPSLSYMLTCTARVVAANASRTARARNLVAGCPRSSPGAAPLRLAAAADLPALFVAVHDGQQPPETVLAQWTPVVCRTFELLTPLSAPPPRSSPSLGVAAVLRLLSPRRTS